MWETVVFDVESMMPIAGGKTGDRIIDGLVTYILITLGSAMLIASILVI